MEKYCHSQEFADRLGISKAEMYRKMQLPDGSLEDVGFGVLESYVEALVRSPDRSPIRAARGMTATRSHVEHSADARGREGRLSS